MIIIHHLIWHYYEVIWAIPLMTLALIRVYQWVDYSKFRIEQPFDTFFDALNFTTNEYVIWFKKVPMRKDVGSPKKGRPKPIIWDDYIDKMYRLYMVFGVWYYISDIFFKISEFYLNPEDMKDQCKVSFFAHHVITVLGFQCIWNLRHYTWFMLCPVGYHTMMVILPKLPINNYIYGFFVVSWIVNMAREPFYSNT